jgi:hypothetical protein
MAPITAETRDSDIKKARLRTGPEQLTSGIITSTPRNVKRRFMAQAANQSNDDFDDRPYREEADRKVSREFARERGGRKVNHVGEKVLNAEDMPGEVVACVGDKFVILLSDGSRPVIKDSIRRGWRAAYLNTQKEGK